MVKEFLSQKGIVFIDKDVSADPAAAQEMMTLTGQRGVPVTMINGRTIIGFNRPALEQALSGYVARPVFGAAVADAATITKNTVTSGAFIGKVHPGSPAERLGLAAGDIINQINGRLIYNASDLENIISDIKSGQTISVTFTRNAQALTREGTV